MLGYKLGFLSGYLGGQQDAKAGERNGYAAYERDKETC